jgi:CHAT domain-containing protein
MVRLAGKTRIEELVSKYREAVNAKLPAREEAAELYGLLLKPLAVVQNANHLVIVPDGTLHLLPFDALVDEHGKYVVQSKNVSYSPSSSTFYLLRTRHRRSSKPAAMLAIGGVPYSTTDMPARAVALGYSTAPVGDLPGSRDEAVDLAKAFPHPENKTLTDGATTETAFKTASNAHAFRFIHLAVHAFASDDPDRATLMMLSDPEGRDDGFLQASEIVQMRINADLVVLSACDTAVGPIHGEEGISTLSNAFLVAGAQTVVSTLWPVSDSPTQFLVKHFYQNMARPDQQPSDAMADAKREMLMAFGTKNLPLYWAGFVVQGSDLSPK